LPVHLPGREQRFHERPYRRMTHLIRDLVDEIGPLVERGCTFWGHSMGAAISVALTRELVDQGLPPPVQLIVSGAGAPDRRGMTNPAHVLDDERLIARLRQYEGTPRAVLDDPDLLSLLLPVIRADFELLETWSSPRAEPLPAPITVLYGEDDASVSDFQLAGWTSYGTVPVDIRRYSGGHFFIREHAAEIADVIRGLVRHAARRGR
jgi:surfactin synthase thioesterase subunit